MTRRPYLKGKLMGRAYQLLYEALKPKLAACDLDESARRRGLPQPMEGAISCDFLGRRYLISNSGIDKADDRPDDINSRSLLIHYLLSEGISDPAGEFVPISKLTGMVPSQDNRGNFFAKALITSLGENYQGPLKAAESLGGSLISTGSGEHHWQFQVLPQITMRLLHYEPDDEYPLDFKYLFDRQAVKVLEFECLAFLVGCFNYELIAATQRQS